MRRVFILLSLLLFASSCTTLPKAHARFTAIDSFGSARLTSDALQSRYGGDLDALSGISDQTEAYFVAKQKIENRIKSDFDFALVELSVIRYFDPNPGRFLTIDVVEKKDVAARMPFQPAPKGTYEDPDGAIALWDEYQNLAFRLAGEGQLKFTQACPVWHCTMGFEDPRLAPYLPRLNAAARKNKDRLETILHDDARANFRGNAAYLLAHTEDGNEVVRELQPAIFDSSEFVRNNAMRVLALMAANHPEIRIPAAPLITALRFPLTTDRNKSASALTPLSAKPESKDAILYKGARVLFEMLKLQQPNNHDPAYRILKNLSGKSFAERDYEAWNEWLERNARP